MTVFTKRAVDVFAPATAGGAARGADMGDAMVWGTEVERATDGASAGRVDQSTWAGLAAIAGTRAGQPAIVVGPDAGTHTDPVVGGTVANVGEYYWSASPAGWRRAGNLQRTLVHALNTGTGTANAVQAASDMQFSTTPYTALITVNFVAANTGAMTLKINDDERSLVTNTGEAIPAGYIQPKMAALVQIDGDGNYRLFSYGDATAVQAAAEAAMVAAEAAAAAAADVMTTVIDPQFATIATAQAFHPVAAPDYIRTAGYAAAGDGGGALYKKAASEPSHAGKFSITLSDGTTVVWYELDVAELYPEMLDAKGDASTDDGAALAASATYCKTKLRVLRLSNKTYKTSVPLDFSGIPVVYAENATISPSFDEGTAVKYLAASGDMILGPRLLGDLLVYWPSVDYTKERWSYLFSNIYMGEFHVGSRNATIGVFLYGNNKGVVYNDFHLKFFTDNCVGVYLTNASSTGWVNMNRFHGGFFTGVQTSVAGIYSAKASHIYIDSALYQNNGNEFIDPSLEWIGPDFKLARISGLKNHLRPGYMEMDNPAGTSATGSWVVDVGAQNKIDVSHVPYAEGYDTALGAASRIDVSLATEPWVVGRLGYFDMGAIGTQRLFNNHATRGTLEASNGGAGPALRLKNGSSAALPALEIANTTGGVGVQIPAAGPWTVYNGTRTVIWNAVAAPTSGTWRRGDLAFNIEPSPGGPVGWVCTADGTPGTWKSFGTIAS